MVAYSPQAAEYAPELNSDQLTSLWLNLISNFLQEKVVSHDQIYEIPTYALAHQWVVQRLSDESKPGERREEQRP
jgi:hypothetical protein